MATSVEAGVTIQGDEGIVNGFTESVELSDGPNDHAGKSPVKGSSPDAFVAVESGEYKYHGDEASVILAQCKKCIVRPYNILLTVIGWRKFQIRKEGTPFFITCLNIVYPIFIFVMLLFTCFAQLFSCFHRSKSTGPRKVSDDYYVLNCEGHLVTYDGISYLMILTSYVVAMYTFRVAEPEHLFSLTERVFLSFNDVMRSKSRRKPLFILLAILVCGIAFYIFSAAVSLTRLFALRLNDDTTIISWFTSNQSAENQLEYLKIGETEYRVAHYSLVVFAFFGFLFFDLLYVAVTINYCSQCQLLTFYIENVQDKVRNKKYKDLNLASKEIYRIYELLKVLNGNISVVASLIFFVFLVNLFLSYNDLIKADQLELNIVTGFLNTIQWLVAALFPVLLAARLTATGNELRRLGLQIASRPFYYSDTPDLELQFFLNFTESTRYQVNLAFVPMQPSFVLGVGFIVLLFLSSGVFISQVESVTWF